MPARIWASEWFSTMKTSTFVTPARAARLTARAAEDPAAEVGAEEAAEEAAAEDMRADESGAEEADVGEAGANEAGADEGTADAAADDDDDPPARDASSWDPFPPHPASIGASVTTPARPARVGRARWGRPSRRTRRRYPALLRTLAPTRAAWRPPLESRPWI
ncbi:hypothetical protein JCM18899A_37480 [Nocardioides sp. AN3]